MPFPSLPSSHAHARETFPASAALEHALKQTVRGEVRFDAGSRALYATDSSNYRQVPIGLVIPQDEADVVATIKACREHGAPILPRGAGTSLAGQCCNVAVIMDFSKFLNRIITLDPASKVARVQPGIVLDRVRDAAEVHHLTFAPDPATHSRCTLGGMIGNNSCGVHALMGGKTVDNIHALDVMLYDGTRMTVGKTSDAELEEIIRAGGRKGEIYAGLKSIRDRFAPLIREKFPRIPRRVSGYNLDELLPENQFNVARALVGSEGTCVTVLEATLRLTASPPFRRLVCIGFPDPFIAADHVPAILGFKPIGLEGFDNAIPDSLRAKGMRLDEIRVLPEGKGVLLVEFGAWTAPDADAQAEQFGAWLGNLNPRPKYIVCTPQQAAMVWHVRESALGAVAIQPGKRPGWEGWEDSAVPPDKLGSYLRAIYALMGEYNYDSPLYGHFGEGCVHMRIDFDLQTDPGIQQFREFIDRATDIVVEHGGSISGEHGDGQSRGALLPKMFGQELMGAFREFKRLWDPENRMNPGKLIDAREPHADLRLGADYGPRPVETVFRFPNDNGSLANATLRCVGVGACRKEEGGAMCPSYMATREEKHSTRGRARLLWELLQGEVLEGGWQNEDVKDALDLCLSCKACKTECPTNVDLATYKAEFLSHYYEGRSRPLYAYAFGMIDRWARMASHTPRLANALGRFPLTAGLAKSVLHIAPQRKLPEFARTTFRSRIAKRDVGKRDVGRNFSSANTVLLWADTFTNYFQPHIAEAAHKVLSDAGFNVKVLQRHVCCGRPLYDFGMLDKAKAYLTTAMDALAEEISSGTPIVVLEPSCASVFRDEAVNLMPDDPRTAKLKKQTLLLSEFLVQRAPDYVPAKRQQKVLVHMHCHHRAIFNMKDEVAVLNATGAEVKLLDSGCCGMAGPFGFEQKGYGVSQTLGERVLLPAVRAAEPGTVIVTDGFSCREQIAQNTDRRAVHVAEVLAGTGR
ncbi:MAG TPA: FAD-binding and (Fe-S)-binding domain-containing protein [Vicinamibacterales bacterium]|nr:FAD-binding and (Fe-S)-binding domain-containing protein [Vicinamibacterales bacterium]